MDVSGNNFSELGEVDLSNNLTNVILPQLDLSGIPFSDIDLEHCEEIRKTNSFDLGYVSDSPLESAFEEMKSDTPKEEDNLIKDSIMKSSEAKDERSFYDKCLYYICFC